MQNSDMTRMLQLPNWIFKIAVIFKYRLKKKDGDKKNRIYKNCKATIKGIIYI